MSGNREKYPTAPKLQVIYGTGGLGRGGGKLAFHIIDVHALWELFPDEVRCWCPNNAYVLNSMRRPSRALKVENLFVLRAGLHMARASAGSHRWLRDTGPGGQQPAA